MRVKVFIAASLDGFIARENGDIDWLVNIENPANDDYGYNDFINSIDAIVMGRATYEKALTFPEWLYTKKVFVLSTTLKSIPEKLKDKAVIIAMPPKDILSFLSSNGYNSIYLDGGRTIQSFLKEDLVDEMIITKIPILLGNGIPLFGSLENDLAFNHISTATYPNGLVKSHYIRK